MAVGVDVIKTTGRLVFELSRDGEKTTRNIEVPYPISDTNSLQAAVNQANATFTNEQSQMQYAIQPANWRDSNIAEEQWTTERVYYEYVQTLTRPIEPDDEG